MLGQKPSFFLSLPFLDNLRNVLLHSTRTPTSLYKDHATKLYGGHPLLSSARDAFRSLLHSTRSYSSLHGIHSDEEPCRKFGVGWATEEPTPDWTGAHYLTYGPATLKKAAKNLFESRSFLIIWDIRAWLLLTAH